jgi:cytochrome c553
MINAKALLPALVATVIAVPAAHAQDPAAGQKKAAMCLGCHGIVGYQASFPQVYKVPKIAGQNVGYLVTALGEYKSGDRKHPTMRAIAQSLSDQDMADLAAYFHRLGGEAGPASVPDAPEAAPAAVAALIAKGVCASCHGANFDKPINDAYPRLAGQYADYLYDSLKAYKTADHPQVGRANPIMGAQVKPFQDLELKAIADYVSSLPGEVRSVPESRFK